MANDDDVYPKFQLPSGCWTTDEGYADRIWERHGWKTPVTSAPGNRDYPDREGSAAAPDGTAALLAAARSALPALCLLGDFIGNTFDGKTGTPAFDRCAIILALRDAIDQAEKESTMPNSHPEYNLVSEEPTLFNDLMYTARRNPEEARWQVFTEKGFAPVGYLEAVHQPTETISNGGWQIAVFDRHNEPLGELRKRAAPGTVPAVDSYVYALALLDRAEGGIA